MTHGAFDIKDGGEREQLGDHGGVRDTEEGKLDWTNLLIWFSPMAERYVAHMTKGRSKYKDVGNAPNWTQFPPTQETHDRFRRSFLRHLVAYLNDEQDEDHAAAMMFNLNGMEWVKHKVPVRTLEYAELPREF